MFKKTDDHGTEKQTKAEEPALLMEDELDAVVAGKLWTSGYVATRLVKGC